MNYIIRSALKSESRKLAELVDHAGRGNNKYGLDYHIWSEDAGEGQHPFEIGGEEFASETGNYSYKNIRVVEYNGEIAALSLSYINKKKTPQEMSEVPDLLLFIRKLAQTKVGAFYLDSLAVLPKFRGKKFGQLLLEDTIEKAKKADCKELCLLAFEKNVEAISLYEKYGFQKIDVAMAPDYDALPYKGKIFLFSLPL